MRHHLSVAAIFVSCVAASTAQAATIKKVITSKNVAIVKVSSSEKARLSPGATVTFVDADSGDSHRGTVKRFTKDGAAIVAFDDLEGLSPGLIVALGATNGGGQDSEEAAKPASAFRLPVTATLFVGMSQLHHAPGHELNFSLGYYGVDAKEKTDGANDHTTGSGTYVGAVGMFNAKPFPVHLGLAWSRTDIELKRTISGDGQDATFKQSIVLTRIGPIVVYTLTPNWVVSGYFTSDSVDQKTHFNGTVDTFNFSLDAKYTTDFSRFVPSLTYVNDAVEVTLSSEPRIEIHDADGDYQEAALIRLAAQYQVSPAIQAQGGIDYTKTSELYEGEKNRVALKVGGTAVRPDRSKIGGLFTFHPSHASEDIYKDYSNVMHVGLIGSYQRPWSKGFWGVELGLEYGDGKAKLERTRADGVAEDFDKKLSEFNYVIQASFVRDL